MYQKVFIDFIFDTVYEVLIDCLKKDFDSLGGDISDTTAVKRNFSNGYHFVIDSETGEITNMVDELYIAFHSGYEETDLLGIGILISFSSSETSSDEYIDSLSKLLAYLSSRYKLLLNSNLIASKSDAEALGGVTVRLGFDFNFTKDSLINGLNLDLVLNRARELLDNYSKTNNCDFDY